MRPTRIVAFVFLLFAAATSGSCVRSETALLEAVEGKIRHDPFLVQFRRNIGRSFGCDPDAQPAYQVLSVYMSLFAEVDPKHRADLPIQVPTVHVNLYCHSAIVSRIYLDLNLWRGGVRTFDEFTSIRPEMIYRIRFEQSDSFAWYISEKHVGPDEATELRAAAVSTRIWKDFAIHVSLMFPQSCEALDQSAVFFREGRPMMLAGQPYQDFVSVLSCPKPGAVKPGFSFKGRYFPAKGFVLPLQIEAAGAYVN